MKDEKMVEVIKHYRNGDLIEFKINGIPQSIPPTPPTQEKECGYCEQGVCTYHVDKSPTQDTESWEEDVAEFSLSLHKERSKGYAHFSEVIYQKFKQKKQEWEKCEHRARWEVVQEERLKEARTQGAEAAVEYMKIHGNWSIFNDEYIKALEFAKKV